MTSATQERYAYTVKEAAQLLGLHPSRVYRLVRAGDIDAIHLGRTVRIPRPALEKLCGIEPSRNGAKPKAMVH